MADLELSFKDPRVAAIIRAAFPGAKTRRPIRVDFRETYKVSDFWDGGSRDECRFVRLSDLMTLSSESIPREDRQVMSNPYNLPIADVKLNAGFVIVVHMISCGKDIGYRIIAHKDTLHSLPGATIPALPEST